jgi:transposase
MVAIATIEEEDAKRPNRERETLIREPTRLINHIKACLVRFAVRGFDTTLA